MLLWAIVHSIFEEAVGSAYPILVHSFFGKTLAEAKGYLRAHKRTDSFLRGCDEAGRWNGVKCRVTVGIYRYDSTTQRFLPAR